MHGLTSFWSSGPSRWKTEWPASACWRAPVSIWSASIYPGLDP